MSDQYTRRQDLDITETYEGWERPLTRTIQEWYENDTTHMYYEYDYYIKFDHKLTDSEISEYMKCGNIKQKIIEK